MEAKHSVKEHSFYLFGFQKVSRFPKGEFVHPTNAPYLKEERNYCFHTSQFVPQIRDKITTEQLQIPDSTEQSPKHVSDYPRTPPPQWSALKKHAQHDI